MAKILDAGKWSPPVKFHTRDGRRVKERFPSVRFMRMLAPNGNIQFLSLGNANASAEDGKTAYFDETLRYKQRVGWLPAHICPASLVLSGQVDGEFLCDEAKASPACAHGSHQLGDPCHHFEAERAHRQMINRENNSKNEDKWAQEERERNKTQNKLNEVLERLAGGGSPNVAVNDALVMELRNLQAQVDALQSGGDDAPKKRRGRPRKDV